jgi:serine/threonine-protein kinase
MFHRFELRQLVGWGTFGRVYRAWDTEMRQQVAVKLPRRGKSASPLDVQTFLREARNASGLRHPNIVLMFEAARHDDTAYMVTEFVEGPTLAEVLRNGPARPEVSAELMMTVLYALHYAHEHEKRVIHRDLKPSNILVDARGRPHLTDFGLAQRDGADGSSVMMAESLLIGTLAYMSPEQAQGRGERVDARSDVFSAGVVLYELLTGELPFRGRGRMLQVQIVAAEPTPPSQLNDVIPAPLEAICLKALAKDPAGRYESALAMAKDLGRFLKGREFDPAPAAPPRPPAPRHVASRPWKTLALTYALIAAIALPVLIVALVQSERRVASLLDESRVVQPDEAKASGGSARPSRGGP